MEPIMRPGELCLAARSSRYKHNPSKKSRSAYWRTSADAATSDGANDNSTRQMSAVAESVTSSTQQNITQQKAVPARTEGSRKINSACPSLCQPCSTTINNGGCAVVSVAWYVAFQEGSTDRR